MGTLALADTRIRLLISVTLAAGLLSACAETELAVHTTKQIRNATKSSPAGGPIYKVGKPYQINGIWYYPAVDYDYAETGIASWYGRKFHGRQTANGEIFSMNELTAAHRTLPLPSLVRVTNLGNGRSLVLRVNDRGPFARGRIIDVSRRAADLLGFRNRGTAKVRVEVLPEESLKVAVLAQKNTPSMKSAVRMPAVPQGAVSATALPGSAPPRRVDSKMPTTRWGIRPEQGRVVAADWGKEREVNGVVTVSPVQRSQIYVQAGSFVDVRNAEALRSKLSRIATANVRPMLIGKQKYYRVRLGPLLNVKDADYVLEKVISRGHSNAAIVIEQGTPIGG